jgi:hypothetical protein
VFSWAVAAIPETYPDNNVPMPMSGLGILLETLQCGVCWIGKPGGPVAERSLIEFPRTTVPVGVTTWTVPVVAPTGTVVVISEGRRTVNVADTPLKVTPFAPVRFVPKISTGHPTLPELGAVLTNGSRPTERLKTVPSLFVPPYSVVP